MWVEARSCTPTTLIPAVIRESPLPLSGQQVIDRVQELNSLLNRGSIYNAANRLVSNGMLERSGDWKLRYEPAKTPLLQEEGTVWGPESMFQAQEKAAHRREAILYILERYETGLMVVQLVEQLKNCSWMKALANKDLVKQDVKKLFGDGKIRKVGNTQKWVLVTAEKGE
jgi:Fe2+ or Zn2+ uptake regulation protein